MGRETVAKDDSRYFAAAKSNFYFSSAVTEAI